jgi:16S rRNA (cytidine1402-2'-O)-methyltransferase
MGILSIVATPIGNLEDITLRALRTLKECTVLYAEDTRVTSKLLARYDIKKPVLRLDAVTELKKAEEILARLESGEHIVFVSDAGTPGISDPGARLVAQVRAQLPEVKIEAIPGASALTTALSIAGLDTDEFTFVGFLPHKKGRQTALKRIKESSNPVVLYESPHRILKLLKELEELSISRVSIARELTKIHEELISGSVEEVQTYFADHPDHIRGEFVVIVEP